MEMNSPFFTFQPLTLPVPQIKFFEILILKYLKFLFLNLFLQGFGSLDNCFSLVRMVLKRKLALQTVSLRGQRISLDCVGSE